MSLRCEEHRGITRSEAEISFQSSFFVGDSIVARPHSLLSNFSFWFSILFFILKSREFSRMDERKRRRC